MNPSWIETFSVTITGQSKEENSRTEELDNIKICHLKKEYGAVKTHFNGIIDN